MSYSKQLKDPRWQKMRLKILERDSFACQSCFDTESMLSVHHLTYLPGRKPWDYDCGNFLTLCEVCHDSERVYRKDIESNLLERIKAAGFLHGSVDDIAIGFKDIEMVHEPEVVASALCNLLSDKDMMIKMVDEFFVSLREKTSGGKNG